MSRICKSCNHTCHCFGDSHIDEYMDSCHCNKCNCGQKEEDNTSDPPRIRVVKIVKDKYGDYTN